MFDGIQKPIQLNPQVDLLSPYLAAYNAAQTIAKCPKVKPVEKKEAIAETRREKERNPSREQDDEEDEAFLSQEEKEQVLIAAKLRGLLNFTLAEDKAYFFQHNAETGLIELIDAETHQRVLTLTPEELGHVLGHTQRRLGIMMDEAG
jgi:hypothetical protein